jgi:eukaryotic-like serine/threonine-protein kinase
VTGESYDQAAADLRAAGFTVTRRDVNDNSQAGIVLSQDPGGGTSQPPGSNITLTVSKGPASALVPDVTSQTQANAVTTLTNAGFKANVTSETTQFKDEDGIVLSQDPSGGRSAKPGTTVTISVGKYTPPTTTTTSTTTAATTTTGAATTTTTPTTSTTPGGP